MITTMLTRLHILPFTDFLGGMGIHKSIMRERDHFRQLCFILISPPCSNARGTTMEKTTIYVYINNSYDSMMIFHIEASHASGVLLKC